jgi:hypothetical protein
LSKVDPGQLSDILKIVLVKEPEANMRRNDADRQLCERAGPIDQRRTALRTPWR